jgi:hypothetical protein
MDYGPEGTPLQDKDVGNWAWREFRKLAGLLRANRNDTVVLESQHNEPPKPLEGMLVLADGTDWDPGSGEGFYGYRGGAWVKLG